MIVPRRAVRIAVAGIALLLALSILGQVASFWQARELAAATIAASDEALRLLDVFESRTNAVEQLIDRFAGVTRQAPDALAGLERTLAQLRGFLEGVRGPLQLLAPQVLAGLNTALGDATTSLGDAEAALADARLGITEAREAQRGFMVTIAEAKSSTAAGRARVSAVNDSILLAQVLALAPTFVALGVCGWLWRATDSDRIGERYDNPPA